MPKATRQRHPSQKGQRRRIGEAQRRHEAPASLTDLERCHDRWLLLWQGTLAWLRRDQPAAYRQLLGRLSNHGLTAKSLDLREVRRRGSGQPIEPQDLMNAVTGRSPFPPKGFEAPEPTTIPVPELTECIPSDEVLARVRRFAGDTTRLDLRGRTRPKRSGWNETLAYYGARWHLTQGAPPKRQRARARGQSLEERAIALVASRYGRPHEMTRKIIKQGRRAMPRPLFDLAQNPSAGEFLWSFFGDPGCP